MGGRPRGAWRGGRREPCGCLRGGSTELSFLFAHPQRPGTPIPSLLRYPRLARTAVPARYSWSSEEDAAEPGPRPECMVVPEAGSVHSSVAEEAMLPIAPQEDPWDLEMEVFRHGSTSSSEVSVVGGTGWKSAALSPGRSWLGGRAWCLQDPHPLPGGPDLALAE